MITLTEISDGILAAINAVGLGFKTVRPVSTSDFEQDSIIVVPPAALLMYNGSELASANAPGTTYTWQSRWLLFVVNEDLAGGDKPSRGAYGFLDQLKNTLAGIDVAGASGKARVLLAGEDFQDISGGKVAYSMALTARTHFQKT